jgi:hypothetical protein
MPTPAMRAAAAPAGVAGAAARRLPTPNRAGRGGDGPRKPWPWRDRGGRAGPAAGGAAGPGRGALAGPATGAPAQRLACLAGPGCLPLGGVPETLVQRLMARTAGRRSGRWPAGQAQLRCTKGLLCTCPLSRRATAGHACARPALDLSHPGTTPLPGWGGCMVVGRHSGGAAPGDLRGLTAPRQGGERFSLAPRATPRSLKKQFQAWACRPGSATAPACHGADGRLLYVPGLGVERRLQAPPGVAAAAAGCLTCPRRLRHRLPTAARRQRAARIRGLCRAAKQQGRQHPWL